jgi:hypothetical protein
MGEFFHGWRRKVGVLTLLVACVVTGIWISALRFRTELTIGWNAPNLDTKFVSHLNIQDQGWFARDVKSKVFRQVIFSHSLTWKTIEITNPDTSVVYPVGLRRTDYDAFKQLNQYEWRWQFAGFDFGRCHKDTDETNIRYAGSTPESRAMSDPRLLMSYFSIPYWSIVFPIVLLSGYLLLSKPRKLTQTKIDEPAHPTPGAPGRRRLSPS